MSEIDISVYSNEDLSRGFNLKQRMAQFSHIKSPTPDQLEPRPITGAVFSCMVRFGTQVLEIPVEVVSATLGEIQMNLSQGDLVKFVGQTGTYDLVMDLNGRKRLWGGSFRVLQGQS